MKMKRSQAARMIDKIRVLLADNHDGSTIETILERDFGISPLKPCTGEAHSNPYIDNCGVCAPRWGHIGEKIEVS